MTRNEAMAELGLSGNPTPEEIKAAFRRRSKATHPDAGGTADAFARTQEAVAILAGKQQPAPAAAASAGRTAPPPPKNFKTREEWLVAAMAAIRREMKFAGLTVPEARVSVGYGTAGKRKTWSVIAGKDTDDGRPQVFVTPAHSQPSEAFADLAEAAAKSMRLDATGGEVFAAVVGMAGPAILAGLGKYPHASVSERVKKTQNTRMLKAVCPSCGYSIRTTKKWAETGLPRCGACRKSFELV